MRILVSGRDLPTMGGTLLRPAGPLPEAWLRLTDPEHTIPVLTDGPGTAALAFKVRPELPARFPYVVYAGGTLRRQAPRTAAMADPAGMESLLNCGARLVLCTEEAAAARGLTPEAMALAVAERPEDFRLVPCGVHVELAAGSPAFGLWIGDRFSDKKFPAGNVLLAE